MAEEPKKTIYKVPYEDAEWERNGRSNAWITLREWKAPDTYPWMKRKLANYLAPRVGLWLCKER
ncbi:MAG TPA: hypothetical protein DIC56_19420 [Rhizobium sp.]|nr:hypothetical protein [Rhizobium sp.]